MFWEHYIQVPLWSGSNVLWNCDIKMETLWALWRHCSPRSMSKYTRCSRRITHARQPEWCKVRTKFGQDDWSNVLGSEDSLHTWLSAWTEVLESFQIEQGLSHQVFLLFRPGTWLLFDCTSWARTSTDQWSHSRWALNLFQEIARHSMPTTQTIKYQYHREHN